MATIREVAKLSGVSTATVSNVLNARNQRMSSETRERVLAAVRQLRYRPSALEENQGAISTENLAVICSDLSPAPLAADSYVGNILDGILEGCGFRGWSLTIFVEQMWDGSGNAVRRSYDGRSDCAIVLAPDTNSKFVAALKERGTPLVLVGTAVEDQDISSVDTDNEEAAYALTEHLLAHGHRRIAYAGPHWNIASSAERFRGYRRAMAEAELDLDVVVTVCTSAISAERIRSRVQSNEISLAEFPGVTRFIKWSEDVVTGLFETQEPPTAIVCWNDALARDVIRALANRGVNVPDQVSVTGFDDTIQARREAPQITTARQPLAQIGLRAAEIAIEKVQEGPRTSEPVRLRSELIFRDSTGPCPSTGPVRVRPQMEPSFASHSRHSQLITIGTNGGPL